MEETTYPEFEILTKTLSKEGKFTIKRTQGSIEAVNTSKMIPKGTTINDKYDYALFGCMAIYHDIENVESLDLKGNGKLKKFLKAFKRGGVTERLKKLCLDTIIELEKAGNDAQKKQKILNSFMLKLHSIVDELSTQSRKATNAKAVTADELASLHVSLLCKDWKTLQEFYEALVKLNKNEPLSPLDKAAKKFKNFINGNKASDSDNGEESDENEEPEDGEDESDENEESDDEADSDDNKKSKKPCKYIFVTGGVLSGVGKGITAASIGAILKAKGYEVSMQKCDPYLNVDAGLLNPVEHGRHTSIAWG